MTLLYMPCSPAGTGKYGLYPAAAKFCHSWGEGPPGDPWKEVCELDAESGVKISLSVAVERLSYDGPAASVGSFPLILRTKN